MPATMRDPNYSENALAGRLLNKPNFRRLVQQEKLVEETGETCLDIVAGQQG